MKVTDPVADMLTRIRNASAAKHDTVKIPGSNLKRSIADILVEEGYIKKFVFVKDDKQGMINIDLRYLDDRAKTPVIKGLRRVSKPGLRLYTSCEDMPQVIRGLGVAIVSTSKGVMTDKSAKKENVGGEVLAFIW